MNPILRTSELSKSFRGAQAVDGLSFDVPQGSVYALVGPNGAGKTTTIKMLMNIIEPSSGSAVVLGTDSRKLGPREFRQLGYVSENQAQPEWMTVRYFLNYLKPFYPNWDDSRLRSLLDQFDLPLERRLRDLSRGMLMKAVLASSLAYHPKLLVLDEPFTGLDALVRDELIEGLIESAEESVILISSHDLAEIESFATHIGYLDNGRLQFSEEMQTLSARFREVEVTLDEPPSLPRPWPAEWLRPEASSAVVRFVETHFDRRRTEEEIRRLFGAVRQIEVRAMPLREIFVALARSTRRAA